MLPVTIYDHKGKPLKENRRLFRAKALKHSLLLRRELALEIEQAGFKGAGWKKIG